MFLTSLSYAFISSYYLSLYRLTVGAQKMQQSSREAKQSRRRPTIVQTFTQIYQALQIWPKTSDSFKVAQVFTIKINHSSIYFLLPENISQYS